MDELLKRLRNQILATPSGELRDLLTELQITLMNSGNDDSDDEQNKLELTDTELYFTRLAINQLKEELKRVNDFYISTITDLGRIGSLAVVESVHTKIIEICQP